MIGRKISMLSLVVGLLGCQDQSPPTVPSSPTNSASTSGVSAYRSAHERVDEQVFVEMSDDAPSFAGFYIDASGRAVVLVSDDADRGRAQRSMIAHAQKRNGGAPKGLARQLARGDFDVRKVKYSFRQLAAWRDLVYDNVLNADGVVYDDMDEVRNRVTIGILRGKAGVQAAVIKQLKELNIPLEAVHFEPTDPVEPARNRDASRSSLAMDSFGSTLGPYDTIGGGYHIRVGSGRCTTSFVGDFGGTPVLATASHCTNSVYALDGGPVKHWYDVTIGTETADPSPTSTFCQPIPYCSPARRSDGALFALNGVMPGVRGAVAHLDTRSSALPPVTSFQVHPTRPWFYITASANWHPVGWMVEKVGTTTGWTYGNITQSCADVRYSVGNMAVRCANWVHLWYGNGDSGSPVFRLDDPSDPNNMSVTLMGILSGGTPTTAYDGAPSGPDMIYTSFGSFDSELGTRNLMHLNPLTVNMLGFVTLDGYISSGEAVLNWNAVTAPELSTPTEYRIYRWTTWRQYDQEGYPYSYLGERFLVATTTSTSFTVSGTSYTSTSCEETDYNSVDHYQIIAWNQGIQSAGSDYCFQP